MSKAQIDAEKGCRDTPTDDQRLWHIAYKTREFSLLLSCSAVPTEVLLSTDKAGREKIIIIYSYFYSKGFIQSELKL